MKERVRVTKRVTFEAAHFLPEYRGACGKLHGHSYKLEITVSGLIETSKLKEGEKFNPFNGMVIDFKNLKNAINEVVGKYDHSNLNDYFVLPTAECMVASIYNEFTEYASHFILPEKFKVESIKLWETEDSYAEYRGETE